MATLALKRSHQNTEAQKHTEEFYLSF